MSFVPGGGVRSTFPAGVLLLAAAAIVGAGGAGAYYHARDSQFAKAMADQQARTVTALNDARGQIQSLSARLDSMAVTATPEPRHAAIDPSVRAVPRRRAPTLTTRVEDPRFQQLQSQLSDQQKELAQAREDLQGKLDSTRDELGSSIARNHDELVVLQKRGERNYHEFTLTKSKEFQVVGPVSLSLRKADIKHKNYNLAMVVADSRLEKKHVNLYEPVMISLIDRPQPVELVVNQISKNEIRGYVSEPKYKRSDLADNTQTEAKPRELVVRQ